MSINVLLKFHDEITKIVRILAREIKFCSGQIAHKSRKLETSFFVVTYCLDMANIFAKFHDSILCGTRVMARN